MAEICAREGWFAYGKSPGRVTKEKRQGNTLREKQSRIDSKYHKGSFQESGMVGVVGRFMEADLSTWV